MPFIETAFTLTARVRTLADGRQVQHNTAQHKTHTHPWQLSIHPCSRLDPFLLVRAPRQETVFGGGDALVGGAAAAAGARSGEAEEAVEDAEQPGVDAEGEGGAELSARRRLANQEEVEEEESHEVDANAESSRSSIEAESLSSTLGGLISTHPVTVPGAWRTVSVRVKHFWYVVKL